MTQRHGARHNGRAEKQLKHLCKQCGKRRARFTRTRNNAGRLRAKHFILGRGRGHDLCEQCNRSLKASIYSKQLAESLLEEEEAKTKTPS